MLQFERKLSHKMLFLKFLPLIIEILFCLIIIGLTGAASATKNINSDEIIKANLSCSSFASDFLCKLDKNIILTENVEIESLIPLNSEQISSFYDSLYKKYPAKKEITLEALKAAKMITLSRDNVMEKLPKKLGFHFQNLTMIIAMKVGLKSIQKNDFKDLNKLKMLNLGDNKLTQIPNDVFDDLKDLEIIYLDGNILKSFDVKVLRDLNLLKKIVLENNQLEILDGTFNVHSAIEEIYLKKNRLQKINVDFVQLKKLKLVDLRNNFDYCVNTSGKSESSFLICDRNESIEIKNYTEKFQKCVLRVIQSHNVTNQNLKNCAKKLRNFSNLKKRFEDLIFMIRESTSLVDFESCVDTEVSDDHKTKQLVENCKANRVKDIKAVEESYEKCSRYRRCFLQFDNYAVQSIDDFQLKVGEIF